MTKQTKIDRMAVSSKASLEDVVAAIEPFFSSLGEVRVQPRKRGALRFDFAADVTVKGAQVAMCAWGGESQRGALYCDVSGQGCQLVGDQVEGLAEAFIDLRDARLRRVDIAADFYDRSVTFESVVDAYQGGKFSAGGRPPKMDCITHADPEEGRTVYIGKRESPKFLRCYEKGLQVAQDLRLSICGKDAEDIALGQFLDARVRDGDATYRIADWFRVEAELKVGKGSDSKSLDWNLVADRDAYFTGLYPYLQEVYPNISPELMLRPQRLGSMCLDAALGHLRQQWGSTLYTALVANHGDILAVWDRIVGDRHNERLVRAGVLLDAD